MSSRVKQKQANRMVREQVAREKAKQRTLWISVVAVAAVIIAGGIGYGVWQAQQPNIPKDLVAPANVSTDKAGLVTADGPVKVEVYVDLLCPACKLFETKSGATLKKAVEEKKIKLEYRPIAILDAQSAGTQYSTRAGAAVGCAADAGKTVEYLDALFEQQPEEGKPGLTDDQLVAAGTKVGLTSPDFAKCVKDGKYKGWMAYNTDAAGRRGVNSTPSVYVNDKLLEKTSPEELTKAIDAAK